MANRSVRAYPVEYSTGPTATREFGPEWTKFQISNTPMVEYRRELKVPVDRSGGTVANYMVQLERDRVHIGEFDDNRGFFVSWHGKARVDVRRTSDGAPAWYQVQFPNAGYLDLNGDGIFDLFADFRQDRVDGQVLILFDNRFIPVKGSAQDFSETMRTAETADGVAYVFERDSWRKLSEAEANVALDRHPTASFFCPRFFCQPGIHEPGCESKFDRKIDDRKMGGAMQQKETK